MRYLVRTMTEQLLRKLIREVIEASPSSAPSTATQPDSPPKDKDDGGDDTVKTPEKAIADYISNTKGAIESKQSAEASQLASTLKQGGVDTKDKIMTTLKNLERDEEGGDALADKIMQYQKISERRNFGKSRR